LIGAKPGLEVSHQGIDIHILDMAMVDKPVVLFNVPLGLSDTPPIGGLVAGPGKSGSVHKGLQKV